MSEPPVLIYAPVGRDGPLLEAALQRGGLAAEACTSAEVLHERLGAAAAALVLTQEALPEVRAFLEPALQAQPPWSDLPLVLLVSPRTARDEHLRTDRLLARHVTILERPVSTPTLLSVVRAAARARRRQRDVRDLLAELHHLTTTLEERVRRRTRQVRSLALELTLIEQRERQRISELLHDHLQQLLFALQLRLELIGPHIPSERLEEYLTLARQLLLEAIQLTRTLSVELHPPVLRDDGLREALEWVAAQARQQYGLEVEVLGNEDIPSPPRELLVLVMRGVRELLFNAARHAGTDRATIAFGGEGGRLRVEVRDEGTGCDPEAVWTASSGGTGLRALRERLALLGGTLALTSAPGRGTTAVLELPLSEASA